MIGPQGRLAGVLKPNRDWQMARSRNGGRSLWETNG